LLIGSPHTGNQQMTQLLPLRKLDAKFSAVAVKRFCPNEKGKKSKNIQQRLPKLTSYETRHAFVE